MNRFLLSGIATVVLSVSLFSLNSSAKVENGSKFPDFTVNTLDGKGKIKLSELQGKIVLVDFWAHWCEPCKISFPVLNKLAQKYKGKVVVVGINVDEDPKDAKDFLKDNPAKSIKIASDAKQELIKKMDVKVMPSSFIIDKTGTVKFTHEGFREGDEKEYEATIAKLLKAK